MEQHHCGRQLKDMHRSHGYLADRDYLKRFWGGSFCSDTMRAATKQIRGKQKMRKGLREVLCSFALATMSVISSAQNTNTLQAGDLQRLRSVGPVELSPDGKSAAYVVQRRDRAGRP